MELHTEIDFGNVPRLLKSVGSDEGLKRGIQEAGKYLLIRLQYYPRIRRQKQPPKTDKQRRFLHWAIREGIIQVPYMRTGGLKRAWQKVTTPDGRAITFTNASKAARYTMNPQHQSRYHKGNWPLTDEVLRRYGPPAYRLVYQHIGQTLQPR